MVVASKVHPELRSVMVTLYASGGTFSIVGPVSPLSHSYAYSPGSMTMTVMDPSSSPHDAGVLSKSTLISHGNSSTSMVTMAVAVFPHASVTV